MRTLGLSRLRLGRGLSVFEVDPLVARTRFLDQFFWLQGDSPSATHVQGPADDLDLAFYLDHLSAASSNYWCSS